MRKMGDEGRDLPREQYLEVQQAAAAAAEAAAPDVEGLHAVVYDDRERALDAYRRDLVSGAAAAAQQILKAADRLMLMTGNGTWNSPNGFDRVAFAALQEAEEELAEAQRKITRLRREAIEYVDRGGWAEPMLVMQRAEEQRRGR